MNTQARFLTGLQPSGDIHIGNYLAALKPMITQQSQGETFLFIVNLHSLTTMRDPQALRKSTYDLIAGFIACGYDHHQNHLLLQSDLPQVTELAWYLSCVTGHGLIEKGHAFKDKSAQGIEASVGLFYYPLLMAADILLYDADIVPVGKDQQQHLEFARDIAGSFNAVFGEVLKLPSAQIVDQVMVVPGTDGRKMSKSYGNVLPVFTDETALRKRVMGIKTDSTPLEAPKELEGSLIGQLYALFCSKQEYTSLKDRMLAGGLGWGHAKEELFHVLWREIGPIARRFSEIRDDEILLRSITTQACERVRPIADATMTRVRRAIGIV